MCSTGLHGYRSRTGLRYNGYTISKIVHGCRSSTELQKYRISNGIQGYNNNIGVQWVKEYFTGTGVQW